MSGKGVDIPLTDKGRVQAVQLGRKLADKLPTDQDYVVLSSTALRAQDPASQDAVALVAATRLTGNLNPNVVDNQGRTALFLACQSSDSAVVQILLEFEADPNVPNIWGELPLFRAADTWLRLRANSHQEQARAETLKAFRLLVRAGSSLTQNGQDVASFVRSVDLGALSAMYGSESEQPIPKLEQLIAEERDVRQFSNMIMAEEWALMHFQDLRLR